ncbi:unnamed protein product [Microthlaspi erraticum]|uniref:Uncharacterized protein n=1 Tax=Microthlaspi erraticum TaxID=1685480 RepID=A0A6D2LCH7_9BRAS|nr:unnamed protein product [Microthlaspi erraticum]
MHHMADKLKIKGRRELQWKLIRWNITNTKEEEKKETIERNTRRPEESHPEAIGEHIQTSPNPPVRTASNFTGATKNKIWRRPKEDVSGAALKLFQRKIQITRSNDPKLHQSPYYTLLVDEISSWVEDMMIGFVCVCDMK